MADQFTMTLVFRIGEKSRSTARAEIAVDLGTPPIAHLTKEEMEDVAFAAKLAVAKVLRARRGDADLMVKGFTPAPPEEHPDITSRDLRQRWLFQSRDHLPPEDFAEFITKSMGILDEWYNRWHGLYKKVNPKHFRTKEEMEHFLRENDLKALGLWHAMRDLRAFWRKAGVWFGNPYDPDDAGEVVAPKKVKL